MSSRLRRATTIELERDGDTWRAFQPDVEGIVGIGPNPGRAVANYGELVAMTTYELEDEDEEDR